MGEVIAFLSSFILGIFSIRPSDILYGFKWIISYLNIRVYKWLQKDRLGFYDVTVTGQPERVGFLSHPVEVEIESPQSELHLTKANDGIFFYGVDSKGDFLSVSISRLLNQRAEGTIYLRLASGSVFQLVKKSDFQQSCANKNAFTSGGLQAYYLSPMKRWRIFFSGYLEETSEEKPDIRQMTYVKFSFLWRSSSDVYDNTSDMNVTNAAECFAAQEWRNITPPTKLFNILDFYAQAGVIMGTVFLDDSPEALELYLFGERMRILGDIPEDKEIEFSHTMGYVHKNGMYLHFGRASVTDIAKNVNYGFVIKPAGSLRTIRKLDISNKPGSIAKDVEEMKAFIDADRRYTFCGSVTRPAIETSNEEKSVSINQIDFYLDDKKGTGIIIKGKYCISSRKQEADIVPPLTIPECVQPMVVAFSEDLCHLPEITGGKGSSLGKLTSLSSELQSFTVPNGVVVSTASYKRFINADILSEVMNLGDVLYGNKEGDPKEASRRICDKIISTKLPNVVVDSIAKSLHKEFGDEYNSIRFAVRSSATGEDTEQMSAAGQMETFLGITGLKNILSAVKKCWASQFGFTAIQYKRRYGQCLNSPMAVVIQEMVSCDAAGVIFTCDPVTGKSSTMSIAANFGLGESVVSASVDPDTIELSRSADDQLKICKITAGEKSKRVVLTDNGTKFEENPENERRECCLSTTDICRLGKLAIQVEKYYRSKRDIEWGIKDGNLYLFQSRPVTSGTEETDFEIEHEFDGTLRVENDYFSVSNAGEVLPGAMATLSRDMFFKQFKITMQTTDEAEMTSNVKARYFDVGWFTMSQTSVFNISDAFHQSKPNKRSTMERASMISFFGRILDNEEPFQIAYDRYSEEPQKSTWKALCWMLKTALFSGKHLKSTRKYYENYRLPFEECSTSKDLYNLLCENCCDTSKAMTNLMVTSQSSTLWNMWLLIVLSNGKEDIGVDVYTDFSKLITVKGDIESADVPTAIEDLAFHIAKSIDPKDFKAMKTEEALQWLKNTPTEAGKKFTRFLTKHGHRCVKEFDIYSTTWGADPKPLVQLLQNLVGNTSKDAVEKTSTSLFKQLKEIKTPLGFFWKLLLLLIVPQCRKGVQNRESAKSIIIKVLDQWRKTTWTLARRMVSEGRIPDEKILFFMTVDEVKELLENRCPKILAKAYHRQRLYPKVNAYRFPEIMRGIPRPITENNDAIPLDGDQSMKGIPVSQGVAKGYIRVAITLDDAASLKPGEILLAYGTDVGWTPYFPSLAGVATELGGLISHGAVVSREYGLPCVAGLHGATRRFRTGDYVLLDGNTGLLQKIPPPVENDQN